MGLWYNNLLGQVSKYTIVLINLIIARYSLYLFHCSDEDKTQVYLSKMTQLNKNLVFFFTCYIVDLMQKLTNIRKFLTTDLLKHFLFSKL